MKIRDKADVNIAQIAKKEKKTSQEQQWSSSTNAHFDFETDGSTDKVTYRQNNL